MKEILQHQLSPSEAALWWLGQAGYVVRVANLTVVIDPYLSDSGGVGSGSLEFSRLYPPPIQPQDLTAGIIIITHNHLDHLDPDTLSHYQKKNDTWFVAPWLTAKELLKVGISQDRIVVVNAGQSHTFGDVQVTGVFALPTGVDVLDTTGYLVKFANGRSVYHTSDTQFHPLVLEAAPKKPDVMCVPINGKWGNPGPEQAAIFAGVVQPKFVLPNHYDTMALNAENPAVFQWFCENRRVPGQCVITERMQPFVWQ